MQVRFVSRNNHKLAEATEILGPLGIDVVPIPRVIDELQTTDTSRLIRAKALEAFSIVGRPLFVEHTSLHIDYLNGLPAGLTQVFWDSLEADRFSELFGKLAPVRGVTAKTVIAFCSDRKIDTFEGEIRGEIVPTPRGPRDFQWDCVFQPMGYSQTFAELGPKKNSISMRKIALDLFAASLVKK